MSVLPVITRRAKARLTDMMVQEVSMVDAAANLKKFVLTKRDETMTDPKATKAALKLPTAAKQGIMDGLAQSLDKLTALATMVGDAEVDDAATVPEELGAALSQVAEALGGMATQFAAPAPPAGDAASPQGGAPPPEAAAPTKNLEGGAPAPTEKKLPAEQHDTMKLTTELREGDSLKTLLHKGIALANLELASTEKAGRKIASARYKKLTDLHDTLGKLLNELAYDDAADAAGAGAADAGKTPAKKADEPTSATELKELIGLAKATHATITTKLAELDARTVGIAKTQGVSNAQPVDGGGAPPPAVQWPTDMSAAVKKNKAAAKR